MALPLLWVEAWICLNENPKFESAKLRTSFTGPVHSIDTVKYDIQRNTPWCLHLNDFVVNMYKDNGISNQEIAQGYTGALTMEYRVFKRPSL